MNLFQMLLTIAVNTFDGHILNFLNSSTVLAMDSVDHSHNGKYDKCHRYSEMPDYCSSQNCNTKINGNLITFILKLWFSKCITLFTFVIIIITLSCRKFVKYDVDKHRRKLYDCKQMRSFRFQKKTTINGTMNNSIHMPTSRWR